MNQLVYFKKSPKLRFPKFDENWEEKRLQNVYEFNKTNSFSRNELSDEIKDGVRNVHYGDIHTKLPQNLNLNYISLPTINREFSYANDELLQVGDLLIADASEDYKDIGKTIEIIDTADVKVVAGLHTFLIRPKEKIALGFGGYLMKSRSVRKQVHKIATGVSVLGISKLNLSDISLYLPSFKEQQKIADFLTAVDKRIELIERRIDLLRKHKKGITQRIFSQKIRFSKKKGSLYPDWEEKSLNEISERVIKRNDQSRQRKILTNSAVQGVVNQTDYFNKYIANQNNLTNYLVVQTDDFVYNPRISVHAPVGPIKRNHLGDGVMSPLYSVFRFKTGNIDFFEKYFETSYWHEYLKSVANYGARHDRMNITVDDLYDLPIPFPSEEEQQKIADFLTAIDDKIELEERRLTASKKFKKYLLQNMFV